MRNTTQSISSSATRSPPIQSSAPAVKKSQLTTLALFTSVQLALLTAPLIVAIVVFMHIEA